MALCFSPRPGQRMRLQWNTAVKYPEGHTHAATARILRQSRCNHLDKLGAGNLDKLGAANLDKLGAGNRNRDISHCRLNLPQPRRITLRGTQLGFRAAVKPPQRRSTASVHRVRRSLLVGARNSLVLGVARQRVGGEMQRILPESRLEHFHNSN